MPPAPRGWAAALLLALAAGGAAASAPPATPAPKTAAAPAAVRAAPAPAALLALKPCELEHPLHLAAFAAECGTLSVPEDPQRPAGRRIGLAVARVSAISRRKEPDPLFVLAGGPGQGAREFYTTVASAFARILRERDIVLVDQRGTGGSNRLDCAEGEDFAARASEADIAAATRTCLATLAARADVAFYTTSLAVTDLERVRAALGYARINLYGSSYGTRVAQQYLRHYPQRTRSVILDGVVPVQVALGLTTGVDAEHALDDILARCNGQAPCRARFGDPAKDYRAVRKALSEGVALVSVPDPSTGIARQVDFSSDSLAAVLRLGSYSADYAALLPLMLHAGADNDFEPLAKQYLLVRRSVLDTLAGGMHNSVVCAEDVPFYAQGAVDQARLALATTYLGTSQLDALQTICRIWPHGPVDADLHAPLASAVPALLLSGSEDPVTSPAYAAEALHSYPRGVSVVLKGLGHGQLTAPCMDSVMAQFIAQAGAVAPDVRCTKSVQPLPFFTSLNGPPP
jgi:pimeloyl-ACP methyl ester carboxylesterase